MCLAVLIDYLSPPIYHDLFLVADYLAPLSEAGDLTPKYEIIRAVLNKHNLLPKGIANIRVISPYFLELDHISSLIFNVIWPLLIKGPRCFPEQETLPLLLSTRWFQERIQA